MRFFVYFSSFFSVFLPSPNVISDKYNTFIVEMIRFSAIDLQTPRVRQIQLFPVAQRIIEEFTMKMKMHFCIFFYPKLKGYIFFQFFLFVLLLYLLPELIKCHKEKIARVIDKFLVLFLSKFWLHSS